jgi:hypothetical protein
LGRVNIQPAGKGGIPESGAEGEGGELFGEWSG